MKFAELKSAAHNLSTSFAGGIGIMVGVYDFDVFREASRSTVGFMQVDFLSGLSLGAIPSKKLQDAIFAYVDVLPDHMERHGGSLNDLLVLKTRYATDRVYGAHFKVTVRNVAGRESIDQYFGWNGKRARR
ncbi:MAG: hypothetical protein AAF216_05375 [Pseudomonadota bacterium]